jgi:uncharacterized membrane protein YgaE (UPF0421/DUF939 family)
VEILYATADIVGLTTFAIADVARAIALVVAISLQLEDALQAPVTTALYMGHSIDTSLQRTLFE